MTLSFDKPNSSAYPDSLQTIGDHIRKRRLDLELFQKHVAQRIDVATQTITNWEKNITEPEIRHFPKVIEFLGYNPLVMPKTFVERLTFYRYSHGLSVRAFASILNICPDTLYEWERGDYQPSKDLKKKVNRIMEKIL